MRTRITTAVILVLIGASIASAAPDRKDVIWARQTTSPITLDGVLNEAAWSQAETFTLVYGQDAGIPGSGWKVESGAFFPSDSTRATLKLLVKDNQLYLGAVIADSSVGGSKDFNRFDGLLMALKDHSDPNSAPKPPAEYFYAWWDPEGTDPQPAGKAPTFFGRWANPFGALPRDSTQIANWDAVTTVQGLSNSDATIDQSYTVEMRFNLTPMGYDVTQPAGDIIEWNIAIYDCDWFWPFNGLKFGTNRVWWQSPWGNAAWYNEVRVFSKPSVTTSSGPVPVIGAELEIPEISDVASPTVDGSLADAVWSDPRVYDFDIRWGDAALRATYPEVGPDRAGQYQPQVNGGTAFVSDPADATVKMFYRDDYLYLGFDVRDEVVQYLPSFDQWDGALITINDRGTLGPDNQLLGRRLSFQVNSNGTLLPQDYLLTMTQAGTALAALQLGAGTTVDTLGIDVDSGYTAEIRLDLTALGYPPGLGDRSLFIGVNLLDGDSYFLSGDKYGTRTWWYREYEGDCCPAWAYLAPNPTGVDDFGPLVRGDGSLIRTVPNPAREPRVVFEVPRRSRGSIDVYDVSGRLVSSASLGELEVGEREVPLSMPGAPAGVYFYRVRLLDPENGSLTSSLQGKAVVVH
ncbi:MAG: hypothetical protein R3B81_16935 [bacterium]